MYPLSEMHADTSQERGVERESVMDEQLGTGAQRISLKAADVLISAPVGWKGTGGRWVGLYSAFKSDVTHDSRVQPY